MVLQILKELVIPINLWHLEIVGKPVKETINVRMMKCVDPFRLMVRILKTSVSPDRTVEPWVD